MTPTLYNQPYVINKLKSLPPDVMCFVLGGRTWESILFGVTFMLQWIHILGYYTYWGSAVFGMVWITETYVGPP